jgi:hypothetical protein
MNNVNILVEAKKEYTGQLQKILRPRIYEGFKSIYEDIINVSAKELEENKIQNTSLTKAFQKILKEVPQWNHDMINNEFNRIATLSNCDYFDSLIEAVFITNTKILTSVQINDNKSLNIKINIPQPSHFIHKCYMKCANEFYKNPYIFDISKNISPKEKHNNLREALSLIDSGINNAISDLLPIGDILKQGLTKNNSNAQSNEEQNNNEKVSQEEEDDAEDEDEDDEDEDDEEYDEEEEKDDVEAINKLEYNENVIDNNENYTEIRNNNNENLNNEELNGENASITSFSEKEPTKIIDLNNEELKIISPQLSSNLNEELKIITPQLSSSLNQDVKVVEEVENKTFTSVTEIENKPELKEIVYTKVTPPFVSKIKGVEKVELNKEKNVETNIIPLKKNNDVINLTDVEPIYQPKKVITTPFKPIIQNSQFIKNIKSTKFKNKLSGGSNRENNSFYKKKYEENSANYNSISDNLKDNIITTLDDLKSTQKSVKIIKNKIMLDDASSDEDDVSNVDLDL